MSESSLNRVLSPRQAAEDFTLLDNLSKISSNEKPKAIEKCISYICFLKVPSKILVNAKAMKAAEFLYNSSKERKLFDPIYEHIEFIQIISNIFSYFYDELKNFLNSFQIDNFGPALEGVLKLFLVQFMSIANFLNITIAATDMSKKFSLKLLETSGVKALYSYLEDDTFVQKLLNFQFLPGIVLPLNGSSILMIITSILYNVSVLAPYHRKKFDDMNACEIMRRYVKNSLDSNKIENITLVYMSLVNLVNDHEIETLDEAKKALKDIAEIVKKCANVLASGVVIKRADIEVDLDGDAQNVKIKIYRDDSGWNLGELISSLYRLAINDKAKKELFETHNIKYDINKIILHGNEWEQAYAVKLLGQLCFDKEIAKKVHEDKRLYAFIYDKCQEDWKSVNKYTKKYCQGIDWMIQNIENDPAHASGDRDRKNHIMISYNRNSRDICLKIKDELENAGYDVWIDVESIHGSTLGSMAGAIEESLCVLMCMTEAYKQSVYCRAEAEYAFTIGRPIVPLILEADYKPDGWLGIILGSKMFVNFMKYTFQESIKRLLAEITSVTSAKKTLTNKNDAKFLQIQTFTAPLQTQHIQRSVVFEWTKEQVQKWISEKEINAEISQMLKNFDGQMLESLNRVRKSAPEYFFKSISKDGKIDLFAVIHLNKELENIFDF